MIRPPPRPPLFPYPTLSRSGRSLLQAPPVPGLGERVYQIFGAPFLDDLLPVERTTEWATVRGYVSRPERGRPRPSLRRSEEHTSELQSPCNLVCRLLLEKKN